MMDSKDLQALMVTKVLKGRLVSLAPQEPLDLGVGVVQMAAPGRLVILEMLVCM